MVPCSLVSWGFQGSQVFVRRLSSVSFLSSLLSLSLSCRWPCVRPRVSANSSHSSVASASPFRFPWASVSRSPRPSSTGTMVPLSLCLGGLTTSALFLSWTKGWPTNQKPDPIAHQDSQGSASRMAPPLCSSHISHSVLPTTFAPQSRAAVYGPAGSHGGLETTLCPTLHIRETEPNVCETSHTVTSMSLIAPYLVIMDTTRPP